MKQLPPPHLFSDPNDRLLASVMPGPPEPFGDRARRRLQHASSRGLRQVRRWLRRGAQSTTGLMVALAGLGVGIGSYLGVTTRAAPAPVVGDARLLAPPAALPPLRAGERSAAPDPIPCATGLTAPAPLADEASPPRSPTSQAIARADAATEHAQPTPRRRALEQKRRRTKLAGRAKAEKLAPRTQLARRTAGTPARRATRPRATNAASVRTAQR